MTSRDALFIFSCPRFPRLFLRARVRAPRTLLPCVGSTIARDVVHRVDSDVIWREQKCTTDVSDIEPCVDSEEGLLNV